MVLLVVKIAREKMLQISEKGFCLVFLITASKFNDFFLLACSVFEAMPVEDQFG